MASIIGSKIMPKLEQFEDHTDFLMSDCNLYTPSFYYIKKEINLQSTSFWGMISRQWIGSHDA